MIRESLKKLSLLVPSVAWCDLLPEVLVGLRMLRTSAHGLAPFHLVYKQDPLHPASEFTVELGCIDWWASDKQEK